LWVLATVLLTVTAELILCFPLGQIVGRGLAPAEIRHNIELHHNADVDNTSIRVTIGTAYGILQIDLLNIEPYGGLFRLAAGASLRPTGITKQ